MIYGGEFFTDLEKAIESVGDLGAFSVDVEGGFNKIPPLVAVRALDKGIQQDIETMDLVSRYCILGRKVTVMYDGEVIGSPFVMNGLGDAWEAFDAFNENPVALQYLFTLCMADLVKRCVPRRKSTLGAAPQGAPRQN